MKNIFNLLIFTIIFVQFGCNKIQREVTYNQDGVLLKIVELQDNKISKEIIFDENYLKIGFHNDDVIIGDTIYERNNKNLIACKFYFYDTNYFYFEKYTINGKKAESGYLKNNDFVHWWNEYQEGKIIEKKHFLVLKDTNVVVETIKYDRFGIVDYNESDFYEWKTNDTLRIGENFIDVFVRCSDKRKKGGYFCIGKNVQEDFSNILDVKLDSFYSETNDFKINVEFNKKGKNYIRGLLHIYFDEEIKNSNSKMISYLIEKEIYVK
ncbi:hypothetical protein AB4865_06920 [Capnocytophaga sp. ARDL2]|uniref:hypothetical protein n=1 Tax=Capnocytophaga sp. ARDL2 TaxID=3238809 RepID=UPI0035587D05